LSRLPSSRSSSSASASSRTSAAAGRRPGVLVQSPKSDVYVAMLGIALAAILLGCLLMTLIFSKYSFTTKVSGLLRLSPAVSLAEAGLKFHAGSVG
jgi:hypothetical protein